MSWAVVTGASGGIGLEIVRQLAVKEPSLHFLLIARREEQLKSLQKELKEKDVRAEYMILDLSKPESTSAIEQRIRKSGYAVRYLINNAGFGYCGRFDEQRLDNISEMIALNITALTVLTRRIVPLMETNSHVMNVASAAAFAPMGGFAVYAATKAFVLHFSVALDTEIRKTREITVTAVCPGPVGTEFSQRAGSPIETTPGYLIERPEVTAKRAVKATSRGRAQISTGLAASGLRLVSWWLPRKLIARIAMGRLLRPSAS